VAWPPFVPAAVEARVVWVDAAVAALFWLAADPVAAPVPDVTAPAAALLRSAAPYTPQHAGAVRSLSLNRVATNLH
jgi:hypothetical protein